LDMHIHRAIVSAKMSRLHDVAADLEAALAISGESAEAHYRKGVNCFKLQDFASAAGALQRAVALDPKHRQSKMWLRKANAELEAAGVSVDGEVIMAADAQPAAAIAAGTQAAAVEASGAVAEDTSASCPANMTPALMKLKHEWYQTATNVVLVIFVKKLDKSKVDVSFSSRSVDMTFELPTGETGAVFQCSLDLFEAIDTPNCKYAVLSTKLEISMTKQAQDVRWASLEGSADGAAMASGSSSSAPAYPSSSKTKRDWTKIDKEAQEELDEEKEEGDAALNKLFKDIYGRADEETRRAMNKSFQTSGGTVLSTNWGEVSKKDYEEEREAPKGMEWKK